MRGIIKEVSELLSVMTSKPVWLCGVAMTLWGLNALSLQQVSFEHVGTVAISHSRLPALEDMAKKGGSGTPYRILSCQLCSDETPTQNHWDMRTVRLRVRAKTHSELLNLENFLLQATEPKQDSPESQSLVQEARKLRWVQETMAHQRKLLASKYEDQRLQIASLQQNSDSTNGAETSSPYQFVGHRTSFKQNAGAQNIEAGPSQDSAAPADSEVSTIADESSGIPEGTLEEIPLLSIAEQLQQANQELSRIEQVAAALDSKHSATTNSLLGLQDRLAASRAHTAGYLSFTGAQTRKPVAMPVGWSRLVVATSLFLSMWCLVGVLVLRGPVVLRQVKDAIMGIRIPSEARSGNLARKAELGIPCFGDLEIEGFAYPANGEGVAADNSPSHLSEISSSISPPVGQTHTRLQSSKSHFLSEVCLRNAATLAIATWALLFAIRFLVDTVWRHLFLDAPLAGLLHLLTGAP